MSDEIVLFEKQQKIYPRKVEGKYRSLKWLSMIVLLGIYYAVPWIRWDRGDHVPDQAVLIDMGSRRAYFFNIELWPQEVYFFAGLMILAALGLFFVTSLLGRVWCGYACPQTVWTDLFVAVERWIQGDRNTQMKLDKGKLSFEKIWKKLLTHMIWILIALCTGGAWVFYFTDAPTLLDNLMHGKVSWMVGGWILGLTGSTYLMAGFAREQVCTYVCPYARFQSAMFDKDTLIIGYDRERGEPRGKHKKGDSWEGKGHCIDCTQCVVVCPMGIDIRNGLQMECIACGLCVDACNDVMDRMELPRGLIRYDTQHNYEQRTVAKAMGKTFESKLYILRPRTYYYVAVMAFISALMLYAFFTRAAVELNVIHDRNPLFVKLSDGSIRNTYTLKIVNKTHEDQHFALKVDGLETQGITVIGAGQLTADNLRVLANSVATFRIMLSAERPKEARRDITLQLENENPKLSASNETVFMSEGSR
ncbi:MAG TPA: cytochrome c oxidase accessory protein CcoG [Alphaproteobacteria bacterium]|nr:cytochrome c oxidase accessory protein CcoG [Alphaproteobacteria bacterium]